jgi:hypothetical protein
VADDEPTLRALYAARPAHPGPHPTEDDWVRLASADMDERERAATVDHAMRCSACATLYRGLLDVEEGARGFDPSLPRAFGPAPLRLGQTARWGTWAAVAAAAAVVFAIAQPRSALAPARTPSPAASSGLELRGGPARRPELASPLGAVARWPESLRWEASAGARAYRVRILAADGEPVWASALVAGTSVAWPASVGPRPGRLYWQVIALPEGGGEADAVASVVGSIDYTP